MAYYIRVLSPSEQCVPLSTIRDAASAAARGSGARLEEGAEDAWTQVVVTCRGKEVLVAERSPVLEDEVGAEELQEFIEELADALPRTGASWVVEYLRSVRTIYALQILANSESEWSVIHGVLDGIRRTAGGITQADGEGFSNEEGFHVVWQFSESVTGPWEMAVLDERGAWVKFKMELGNPDHRRAFQAGAVPPGVQLL